MPPGTKGAFSPVGSTGTKGGGAFVSEI
jgi:hypothetical protein